MYEKLIEGLKKNIRWRSAEDNITKYPANDLTSEEIMILNVVAQLEAQGESRAQAARGIELSERMAGLAETSTKMADKLVCWTKRLAFATFALAVGTLALAIITALRN